MRALAQSIRPLRCVFYYLATPFLGRIVWLSMITILLTNCTFLRAVSFQSDDETSFKRTASQAILELYGRANPDHCKEGPLLTKKDPNDLTAAVPVVIIAALAQVAVNIASSEMAAYLQKKAKGIHRRVRGVRALALLLCKGAPTLSRRGGSSADGALPPGAPPWAKRWFSTAPAYSVPVFNCLRLTRTITEAGQKTNALVWIGAVVPSGSGTALKAESRFLALPLAAARTDRATRAVEVSVELKLDATVANEKGQITTINVADKIIGHPDLHVRSTYDPDPKKAYSSSWFPAIPKTPQEIAQCAALNEECAGVSAVSVSILVTEVGSGGEAFGELGKQIDDNKKTLSDAVNKAVTDALTEKPKGGSSK